LRLLAKFEVKAMWGFLIMNLRVVGVFYIK